MAFETVSSESHASWYDKVYNDIDKRFQVLEDWEKQKKDNTITYWIHKRMFSLTDALAQPNTSWLTVGDGYGFDANYFRSLMKGKPDYYSITSEYQLIYWGGCNSYSYYALPFFNFFPPQITRIYTDLVGKNPCKSV